MRFLLDTHTLFWAIAAPVHLSGRVSTIIADPANELLLSAASAWEVASKVRIGKWPEAVAFRERFPSWYPACWIFGSRNHLAHALAAGRLPGAHKDPWDRMIAAQALSLDVPVLSRDSQLDSFRVNRIW